VDLRPTEVVVLCDLRFDRDEIALFLRDAPERAQQDGLADAAEADDDHRLIGVAHLQAPQQHSNASSSCSRPAR
jgi:hypothetical protein